MKNLKISSKLAVAFGVITTIFVLGIIGLLFSYMISNERLNNMIDTAVTPDIALGGVREGILRERVAGGQLVLHNPDTPEYREAAQLFNEAHQNVLKAIAAYKDVADEAGRAAADDILSYYEGEYSVFKAEVTTLIQSGEYTVAAAKIASSGTIEADLDARLDKASGLINDKIAFFKNDARIGLIRLFIIAGSVIVFIAALITYIIRYMNRNISHKIENLTYAANLLATGDLNINISSDSGDEIGRLTDSFLSMADSIQEQAYVLSAISDGDLTVNIAPRSEHDTMNKAIKKVIENLNAMFVQISESTNQVSTGAKQIADGSQTLAQGATEQAATVDDLSHSIAEVARTTRDNSAMAKKTAQLMESVTGNATEGSLQMDKMAQAVQDINAASQSISKVIKAIDDIAFQTNILSLNAAVEAAHAGVHGKGFAVVADEVRNLASKSAEAAKNTGALIENSIEKAMLGARIAQETVTSFEEIVSGINESANLLNDIAKASEQQSNAISRIDDGIGQVAQVVQQNSATAQEAAASSEELRGQSELLRELTVQFKTKTELNSLNVRRISATTKG